MYHGIIGTSKRHTRDKRRRQSPARINWGKGVLFKIEAEPSRVFLFSMYMMHRNWEGKYVYEISRAVPLDNKKIEHEKKMKP